MFSNIQLPKVVADTEKGGGFVTNLSGINALSQQNLQNRLLQAQGNLAQQQANFTPYQYATQALSNPALWLTAEGRAAGQNIIKQLPLLAQQGSGAGGQGLNQLDSQSLGQLILSKILGKGGDAGGLSSNPLKNLASGPAGAPISNIAGIPEGGPMGSISNPSGVGGAVYNTPANAAANANTNGLDTSATPLQTQEANAAAQNAGLVGQVNNQNEEQKKLNEQVNTQSSGAVNALKSLEGWWKAYKDSSYKGQYAGSFPAAGRESIPNLPGHNSAPEELADQFQSEVLQATADMQNSGGGITDDARALLSSAKGLSRSLDEPAAKVNYESKKAGLERIIQSRQFLDNFYKNNPTATKEQAIAMMNNYNKFAPPYDYSKFKPLPENNKRFKEFTSKEALNSYIQNGEYIPPTKGKNPYKMEIELGTDKKNTQPESPNNEEVSQEDLEHTAKKYNMTVNEVKKYLGIQ